MKPFQESPDTLTQGQGKHKGKAEREKRWKEKKRKDKQATIKHVHAWRFYRFLWVKEKKKKSTNASAGTPGSESSGRWHQIPFHRFPLLFESLRHRAASSTMDRWRIPTTHDEAMPMARFRLKYVILHFRNMHVGFHAVVPRFMPNPEIRVRNAIEITLFQIIRGNKVKPSNHNGNEHRIPAFDLNLHRQGAVPKCNQALSPFSTYHFLVYCSFLSLRKYQFF